MKRYAVPRIAFINKMDRTGANPANVIQQLESKLGLTTIPLQLPIGAESSFQGVIDLIDRVAYFFDGEKGEDVRQGPIPADMVVQPRDQSVPWQGMLEALSMISDQIMELLLEESEVPIDLIHKTIREGTIAQQLCPVMVGSAYRNKGVQSLLDAICRYLPSPLDRETFRQGPRERRRGSAAWRLIPIRRSVLAMAFKLVEEAFGQVTFVRIYQGTLSKGTFYFNSRQRKRTRISRILRVHADQKPKTSIPPRRATSWPSWGSSARPEIPIAARRDGDLVARKHLRRRNSVIDLSIQPLKRADYDKLSKAFEPLCMREDPDIPGSCR